jgi:hypothetical protein
MPTRASAIEKLVFYLLLSGYIYYLAFVWRPASVLATTFFIAGLAIIAWAAGKFLSGDSDRIMLIVIALVIVAEALLFVVNPGGVTH